MRKGGYKASRASGENTAFALCWTRDTRGRENRESEIKEE